MSRNRSIASGNCVQMQQDWRRSGPIKAFIGRIHQRRQASKACYSLQARRIGLSHYPRKNITESFKYLRFSSKTQSNTPDTGFLFITDFGEISGKAIVFSATGNLGAQSL